VRYIYIICILFLQLANGFTAEAGTRLPVKDASHKKEASLSIHDLLHHHAAEVARSIRFSCSTLNARDQRENDGLLSLDHLSDQIAGDLRTRINDFSIAHWTPLIRLLLFPNHYFW